MPCAGAVLASACSGAVLLARTGLLNDLDATSHWAYCETLKREHPRTRWHAERGLVVAGEGQRLVMAGSGVAWHVLVLYLIARFAGPEEAMQVARINLMDLNATSPVAYASLTHGAQSSDPVISRCQQWAAMNYQVESPVTQMVALSGLAGAHLQAPLHAGHGHEPARIRAHAAARGAKQMLEASDAPIEAIAVEVGYQDTSFFGRLFRRKVALSPAQYRRASSPSASSCARGATESLTEVTCS
jgi:transcriptional regulator GlxA family with amidase domain